MDNKESMEKEKLVSLGLRFIPFYNTTDTTRLQMVGKYFSFQAVPFENVEIPHCLSKNFEDIVANSNSEFIKIADDDGEVLLRTEDLIVVRYENGLIESYYIPEYKEIFKNFGTKLRFSLNTGDKFKLGDVIFEYYGFKNGIPTPGYNTLVAYGSIMFMNHEDAVIISESYAKRVGYWSYEEHIIPIYTYSRLVQNSHGKLLPEPGEKYSKDETILNLEKHLDLIELIKMFNDTKEYRYFLEIQRALNNPSNISTKKEIVVAEKDEEIYSIEVFTINPNLSLIDSTTDDVLKQYAEETEKKFSKIKNDLISKFGKKRGEYLFKKHFYINKRRRLKEYEDSINNIKYLVRLIRLSKQNAKAGHKISNTAANKGTFSIIIPDELMPKTKDGKIIDMIISPAAIPSRMNVSQLYEFAFSKAIRKAQEWILSDNKRLQIKALNLLEDLINLLSDEEIRSAQLKVIRKVRKNFETEIQKVKHEIEQNGALFVIVDNFKDPEKYTLDDVIRILEKYGIPFEEEVIIPNPKELYKFVTREKDSKILNFIPEESITTVMTVGYEYIMYLEHVTEKKFNARSTGKYSSTTLLPPRGRRNQGGSRIGNDEIAMLFAYDSEPIIKEMLFIKADDHYAKREFIISPIKKDRMMKTTDYKKYQSVVYNLIENMMNSMGVSVQKQRKLK